MYQYKAQEDLGIGFRWIGIIGRKHAYPAVPARSDKGKAALQNRVVTGSNVLSADPFEYTIPMKNIIFLLGLGTLVTHELDAMTNAEWRVLPLLSSLSEDIAIPVFVLLHIPLVALIVGFAASKNERTQNITKLVVSTFLLLHGIGHWLTANNPSYEFSSTLSAVLIYGGAALGAIYLLLNYVDASRMEVS